VTRAVLLVALLAVAVWSAPAQAGIVSAQDAAELAQDLADAQEEQDVCYGWNVTNNFSSDDVGSSTGGPGVALVPDQRTCPKGAVILRGNIDYSCSSCESSDSASVSIASNLPNPPTVDDLERLGLKAGALTGDDDDTTLVNMVDALPLLVADRGNAAYVGYEPAKTVPAADHATGKPGSDLMRDSWLGLLFFGGLILAGPGFFLYKRSQAPRRPPPTPPAPPAPASGPTLPATSAHSPAPPPADSAPPPANPEPPPPANSEPPPPAT
jgi:hypothetical protein